MKKCDRKRTTNSYWLSIMLCVLILTFHVTSIVFAQPQNVRFIHLTNEKGLSQNWVHAICQDKYGFIWIGTEDGLNRYDGYNFTVYKHDRKNGKTLSNSSVNSLFEDSNGNLWVGTSLGLNLYDRQTDGFIQKSHWPSSVILDLVEDEENNLWMSTYEGVYKLHIKSDSITRYQSNNPAVVDSGYLSSNLTQKLFVDSKKNVWIGTDRGVNLYVKEKDSFINYYHDDADPHSLAHDNVSSIAEDSTGRIWIGTAIGIDLFVNSKERPARGKFIRFRNNERDENSISSGRILALLTDKKNNLWIGIENDGLDMLDIDAYDKGVTRFSHFQVDPNSPTSLNDKSVYSLFQDRQDNIWIGTFGKGINIISPISNKFAVVKREAGNKNSLNDDNIGSFCDEQNYLWIGTGEGLNRYDKRTGQFKHFVHDPGDRTSISSDAVTTIGKDRRGNIWVGTWGAGLNLFNHSTETFSRFKNVPGDGNSLSNNNIFAIAEDKEGKLWIGTMGGGLNMYDPGTKKFVVYNDANSNISGNYVQAIIVTKKGDLWLTNVTSLERLNKTTGQFEHFRHDVNDTTSLSGARVISLFEDSRENIWVGTDNGLNLYIKSSNGFTSYQTEDGLPSNFIVSINEDNSGNLWIGTNAGLSKFVNAVNNPPKSEFRNYTTEDGLQGNEFIRRSSYKGIDGKLYFGGGNGFNVFDPEKVVDNKYVPPVFVTDFQIFNKPVPIAENGSPLQQNIGLTKELVLSYTHSVFSFDFVALNYSSSAKNRYAYMMEGFDKEWNYIGTKRTATYTNLDPGEYVFRVKGSNNDGVWNEQGASIRITITPPFWQTLWFMLIVAAVVLGIAFWSYKRWLRGRELGEKLRIEQALEKERNLLRMVIDNLPDGIYTKDLNCRKTLANRADVYNMGRNSETEVLGKDDFELFPKEMAEGFIADDRAVLQTGKPVINREEFVIDAQGQKHFLLTTKLPFRNEQDEVIGLIGIGRDITDKKRAEEILEHERNLFRTVLDNVPDLIYFKDAEGKYLLNNTTHLHSLGATKQEEVIGKATFDFNPRELAEVYHQDEMSVVRSGEPILDKEEIAVHRDTGTRRWHLTSKIPLKNSEGKVIGIIGISRDITSRKEAELKIQEQMNIIEEKNAELEKARDAAMKASKAKSSFLANMSHELRTPLNGIIGMTDLALQTTSITEEQHRYLSGVKSSAEILLSLINDILDFSKIEADKLELNLIDFSLRDELAAALQPLGSRADEKGIELFYDVDQEIPDWVRGDAFRLKQIIINLVGNAIKFTSKGEIKVLAQLDHQMDDQLKLRFTVSDTGIGIPENKRHLIFESFTQADSSVSRKFGGTGLGLAISLRLVELMGGKISVESEVGKGSKFHFTVSFSKATAFSPIAQHEFLTGLPALIVDDNDSIRDILEKMLKSWRMNPTTVRTGKDALQQLRTAAESGHPYQLMLLDIRLPDMDGAHVVEQAAPLIDLKNMDVIVISMSHSPGDIERLRNMGITTYLTKPFSHSELLETIQSLIVKRRSAAKGMHSTVSVKSSETKKMLDVPPKRLLRILVAEDNPMNQEVARSILLKRGHTVIMANNGREAVDLFKEERFDIILMDIQMPEMDGYEATAKIREMEKTIGGHISIIAVTANAMKEDEERCIAAGMDSYVSKPLRMLELINKVERYSYSAHKSAMPAAEGKSGHEIIHSKEKLIEEMDGDDELLKTVVKLCLENLPVNLKLVHESINNKDFKQLEFAAHTVKGAANQFGASRAGNVAYQLEQKGRNNDFTGTESLAALLDKEIDIVVKALQKLM